MKYINTFNRINYIYKISNSINSKIYIGKTVQPRYRFRQYVSVVNCMDSVRCKKIHKAMIEIGIEKFTFEVIEAVENSASASGREDYWIDFYKSNTDECGYNENGGIERGDNRDSYRRKMSERMSTSFNPMKGKKHTSDTKNKLSSFFSGDKNPFYGKKHSKETKYKIGLNSALRNTGANNPRSKLSDEQVVEIRKLWSTGQFTKSEIAITFNVTATTISQIIRRKTRKNI